MVRELDKWHLRFSVTPLCNFKCSYCNPSLDYEKIDILTDKDILKITEAASLIGIKRVHWTGGEPSMRNLELYIEEASKLGFNNQIITTNGAGLDKRINTLSQKGLTRINVSLDSLDPNKNSLITGVNRFSDSYKTLIKSLDYFEITKLNAVLMEENFDELEQFIELSDKYDGRIVLKFIELTPNNPVFYSKNVNVSHISAKNMVDKINNKFGGMNKIDNLPGDNPNCTYYNIKGTKAVLGYVAMPSTDYNCGADKCRKLRLNPFGYAGICIGTKGEFIKNLNVNDIRGTLNSLISSREDLCDEIPDRKHYQGTYGYWRFGDLNGQKE